MSTITTIKAGETGKTISITEGKSLILTGSSDAVGVAYLVDPVAGSPNSTKTWAVGAGVQPQIGPYVDSQKVLVTCAAGSIAAVVQDAVASLPQIVVSSSAPNNNDGRPDGTIYIQTA